jgi:hypothetical protein
LRSEDGTAPKATVLKVLELKGVTITDQVGGFDDMKVFEKGNVVESHRLPDPVGKKMLHYLARVFEVPIHLFYE